MNKSGNRLLLMAALLLTVNCGDISGTSEKDSAATDVGDTEDVCKFDLAKAEVQRLDCYGSRLQYGWPHLLKNREELISYIELTGHYDEHTEREITNRTNFKEYIYFAASGSMGSIRSTNCKIIAVTKDTVTINYTETHDPVCDNRYCPDRAPSPPFTCVFFIPFTKKAINFTKTIEHIKCGNPNCSGNK